MTRNDKSRKGLEGRITKEMMELLRVQDIFIVLIVVMFLQVYSYVKTYQIIYFKYIHLSNPFKERELGHISHRK